MEEDEERVVIWKSDDATVSRREESSVSNSAEVNIMKTEHLLLGTLR